MTNTIEQMSVRKKSFALHAKGFCRPHRAASAAPEAGPSRSMKQGELAWRRSLFPNRQQLGSRRRSRRPTHPIHTTHLNSSRFMAQKAASKRVRGVNDLPAQ